MHISRTMVTARFTFDSSMAKSCIRFPLAHSRNSPTMQGSSDISWRRQLGEPVDAVQPAVQRQRMRLRRRFLPAEEVVMELLATWRVASNCST
jgi:hypothetical protein